ncbi:hypothetical protein [Streptomyces platensis]|uniref:hypothetical protein n=1 Tax=Streptomyces platensis TaxID=58346 RepID=UPI00117D4B2C|nr:hypothetical protein [Streptomyces platensis]
MKFVVTPAKFFARIGVDGELPSMRFGRMADSAHKFPTIPAAPAGGKPYRSTSCLMQERMRSSVPTFVTDQDLTRTLAVGAEHYGLTGLAAFTPPIQWLGTL